MRLNPAEVNPIALLFDHPSNYFFHRPAGRFRQTRIRGHHRLGYIKRQPLLRLFRSPPAGSYGNPLYTSGHRLRQPRKRRRTDPHCGVFAVIRPVTDRMPAAESLRRNSSPLPAV